MAINSITFTLFFCTVFILYYAVSKNKLIQNLILLLANYVFYGFIRWELSVFLLFVTVVTYFIGLKTESSHHRKTYATLGIMISCGMLAYFKYFNFFIESFESLLESFGLYNNWHTFSLIVPLGISFFTFKIISYIVEIYKSNITAERDFIAFADYISFFPTIASGPIDRPNAFLPQLHCSRSFNYELAVDGTRQILWGLFKKLVVADNLANAVDSVWADYSSVPGCGLFYVACLYSIQIYADFSGYSDMSIGVGKLLGFNIMTNFRLPYFSRNMSEFWHKWHISLTSWFTDYIYKPLGGSRCSKVCHLRNIMIVFLVSGLWHGADWSFVLWGGYHGILLIILVLISSRKYKYPIATNSLLPSLHESLCMIGVFVLSCIGWIFFRADNIIDAFNYISCMLTNTWFTKPNLYVSTLPFVIIMFALEWITRMSEHPLQIVCNKYIKWILYFALTYIIIYHQGQSADFIYFKF